MAQLHLAPPTETADAIRKLAAKEGVSVNAYITPFLNDIAAGRLVRVPHYPPQGEGKRAA